MPTVRWERDLSPDSLPELSIDGGNLRGTYDPPNVVRTPSRLVVAGRSAVTALDTADGSRTFAVTGLDSVVSVAADTVDGAPRVFVATTDRLGTARV